MENAPLRAAATSVRRTAAQPFRFNPKVKKFGQHVLNGYNSCNNLKSDVKKALKLLADTTIQQEKTNECSYYPYPMYSAMADTAVASSTASLGAAKTGGGETSYATNNQVEGVDEADIVKSDGTFIYLGYGSDLIVTDLEGVTVTNITLPPPPNSTNTDYQPMPYGPVYRGLMKMWSPGPSTRTVQSLLLHKDIVTVIATYNDWQCDSALCGGVTNAFIYKFNPDEKNLTLLTQIDINGGYSNARSIGGFAHIATTASVDTWSFSQQLYRCNEEYKNMTSAQYEVAAFKIANATVAKHAEEIMKGMTWTQSTSASCKHVMQISSLTNQDSQVMSHQQDLSLYGGESILQNFVQLTSFDMGQEYLQKGFISSASGAFTNAYSPQMYATEDRLLLASNGYSYKTFSNGTSYYDEYTYLMSFNLSGAVATPNSVGKIPGYLNDQYSMDYFNGAYRIATTSSQRWATTYNSHTKYYSWEIVADSKSQVVVLEEQSSKLVTTGSVNDLGKGETIQSVRFFGDKGYVVTFRQVDPLYVIDFSAEKPKIASELKVTGFSDFMYPIKSGTFLLTVGNEADVNGTLTGMKISVFNVTDPSAPSEAEKYVVPFNSGSWASSDAQWDPHAFRYLDQSEKLIIPLYVSNWEHPENSFDGFVVYNIDLAAGITLSGNVSQIDSNDMQRFCWGNSYLPSRSMVFAGDLVTFKTHSIVSTDLSTMKRNWEKNLDEGRDNRNYDCNMYLY